MAKWEGAALFLLLAILLFSCAKGQRAPSDVYFDSNFSLLDIFGRELNQSTLDGRFLYLQFINKSNSSGEIVSTEILERLSRFNNVVTLLIFPESITLSPTYMPLSNLYFIMDKGLDLKRQFNALICCDGYLIYNQNHELIYGDLAHNASFNEAMPYLTEIHNNKAIEDFGPKYIRNKIEERGIAREIFGHVRVVNQAKNHYVVALITNLCSSCLSGRLFEFLNMRDISDRSMLSIHIFLSEDYGAVDFANLRSAFDVNILVQPPPDAVLSAWLEARRILPSVFNDLFFVLDDQGSVCFVLDRRDPERFFSFVKKLGNK